MPHTLRDDEGVAADCDRDVVVPPDVAPTFEVIEAELALHFLIDPLGAISLLEESHGYLLAHGLRQRSEREVIASRGVLLEHQPLGLTGADDHHAASASCVVRRRKLEE